jgi:hypothetical protein
MPKVKMTISVDKETADYVRAGENPSAIVAEAVAASRSQKLQERLKDAYREDAAESARLNLECEHPRRAPHSGASVALIPPPP